MVGGNRARLAGGGTGDRDGRPSDGNAGAVHDVAVDGAALGEGHPTRQDATQRDTQTEEKGRDPWARVMEGLQRFHGRRDVGTHGLQSGSFRREMRRIGP